MPRFNMLRKIAKRPPVRNHEGGTAYRPNAEQRLAHLLLTNFLTDQFYRSADRSYAEIVELLGEVAPEFAARAALFARTEYGMRTVSHVVAAHLATRASGTPWARQFYDRIVYRPDDMLEITALLRQLGAKGLPNAVRKGFASAFDRFDGYQLAKYRQEKSAVSLVDIVNLVHPVPTRKNARALQQLVDGTLRNTRTWEAKLSSAGQDKGAAAGAKAEAWTELLTTGKIGYFALVRNLRNLLETAPELAERTAELLTDEARIRKSLVLPFRLLTAYRELEKVKAPGGVMSEIMRNLPLPTGPTDFGSARRTLLSALDRAIRLSFANLPALPNTLVAVDNSGSMASPVGGFRTIKCCELGALFGLELAERSNAALMEFGSSARYLDYRLGASPLAFASTFAQKNAVGHGTNFEAIFELAGIRKRMPFERIIILSDMQSGLHRESGAQTLARYRKRTGVDPYVYTIDLAGYGTSHFPTDGGRTFELAGFSEKLFELFPLFEAEPNVLVERIRGVEL